MYGQHGPTRLSMEDAIYSFFLAEYINKGITTLSISDKLLAEHNFVKARGIVETLSGRLITTEMAEKWEKQLDKIIRLTNSDDRTALRIARDLLLDMEIRFMQSLSKK